MGFGVTGIERMPQAIDVSAVYEINTPMDIKENVDATAVCKTISPMLTDDVRDSRRCGSMISR